jgi:hypothetical protein
MTEAATLALIGLAVAVGAFVVAFVLPVISFLRTGRALREAERANQRVDALARVVQDLARERREGAPVREPWRADAEERAPGPGEPRAAGESPAAPAEAAGAHVGPTGVAAAAEAAGGLDAAAIGPMAADLPGALTVPGAGPTPPVVAAAHAVGTEAPGAAPPVAGRAAAPHVAPTAGTPFATAATRHVPTLEQRIGSRWLLYAGIAALVLGAGYLVKLAFDNNWITPAMRVGLSALGGGILVAIGLRFADRGLAAFGHLLAGGGIAVLYVSIYAALHLYELVGRGTAFAAMTVVTAAGAWLADRRMALGLATVALLGGFATPFLVGGERDAYVVLFTYVTVLAGGASLLARRHGWPSLTLAAFLLTVLTFGAWTASNYSDSRYLVVQGFLTIWLVLFLLAVSGAANRGREVFPSGREETPPDPYSPAASRAAPAAEAGVAVIVGIVAPVLYHAASLSNLARHTLALLIYFILATLAAILYAGDGRRTWARLLGWLAVSLPFLGWLSGRPFTAGSRAALFAMFGLHLLAELRTLSRDRTRLDPLDTALLHLNGLGLLAGLLISFPRWDTAGMSTVTAGVAGGYALLAAAVRTRHDSAYLHYVALASAAAAGALALRFQGTWVTLGWAVEGALLAWLGLRERRQWLRAGGGVLLALAIWNGIDALDRDAGAMRTAFVNASALSMLAIAALLGWVAQRYARAGDTLRRGPAPAIAACMLTAAVLVLFVLTNEINRIYGVYAWRRDVEAGAMAGGAADLARQVTLSIVWAAYGVLLVGLGIARRYAPIRYLAILLLAATIAKVFFVDLATLDRVYRVLSVAGLGVLLIAASYLYQRFLAGEEESAPAPSAGSSPVEPPGSGRE